jgi:hypothetical protein
MALFNGGGPGMATLRNEGTNAALAAERRAAVRARESARQEAEGEERKARGAGALELERLRHLAAAGERAALAEGAAAEKQRMARSLVRRSEAAGRNLQLQAKQRLKEREAVVAEAAAAAAASWEVQQKAAIFSERLNRAFLEYVKIDRVDAKPSRGETEGEQTRSEAQLAEEARAGEEAARAAAARAAARVAQRASKPGAPKDSMLAQPASRCVDGARASSNGRGSTFSSLPRWSASGTMPHHTDAVPSTAPRLASAGTKAARPERRGRPAWTRQEQARQEVTEMTVAAAAAAAPVVPAAGALAEPPARPGGSMVVEPASQIRDPARAGIGFLGLAAPGGLGYGAAGTKFSHVRRFAEDDLLAGPVARGRGGVVPCDPAAVRALAVLKASTPALNVVECCGDAYDGYCCKRHHPDDAIVCCKRHGPAATVDQQQISGRAAAFPRAERETAVGAVPRGHTLHGKRPAPARFRPPRRLTPASIIADETPDVFDILDDVRLTDALDEVHGDE